MCYSEDTEPIFVDSRKCGILAKKVLNVIVCRKLLDKFLNSNSSAHSKGVNSRMKNLDAIDVYYVVNT